MENYKNLSGNSGVLAYKIDAESIVVKFREGRHTTYVYTYMSTGKADVEQMKSLARAGKGLNSYISTNVKKRYESRF